VTGILDFLLEPLKYPFMVRGLISAAMVGIVCATVGTYIVLRGMAFLGDALAHAILPGVAIGYLVSEGAREPLFWWALASAIVTSIGIGTLSKGTQIKEDTATGIIFASMFALGIAIISTVRNYAVDLTHFLFGDVLGVSSSDVLRIALFGGGVILLIIAFYKEFLVISFDPTLASTLRMPTKVFDYLLLIIIAVTTVISLQTVGVALMVAMLVTPAATAYLLVKRLQVMMALSAFLGALACIVGLYLSYYLNIASGAAIVLTSTLFFLLVWIWRTVPRKITPQVTQSM
jgi:manganese/iron transport system permease protein